MSLRLVLITVVIIIQIVLVGSGASADLPGTSDISLSSSPESNQTDTDSIATANNKFTADLYRTMSNDPLSADKNLIFSPFSIFSALAVTYEGARNTTADEMGSVLYLPKEDMIRRNGYFNLNSGISSSGPDYNLTNGNALWVDKTYPVLAEYLDTSRTWYNADVSKLDFKGDIPGSVRVINEWVEKKTEQKIPHVIDPESLPLNTNLIITNAIYFKGAWEHPFDKNLTFDDLFNTSSGRSVTVPMMHTGTNHARYNYTENDYLQVLELPYGQGKDRQVSMVILLPKTNLSAAEPYLDSEAYAELQKNMQWEEVNISLPKFTLNEQYSLSRILASLGMPDAFSEKADFSGIDGTHTLYISDVVHSSYVDVYEEGTEAAAATGAILATLSIEKNPVFKADHPFIFFIRDSQTGTILFIGRVMNPAS